METRFTLAREQQLLEDFVPIPSGPVPSSYRTQFIESQLVDLEDLDANGSTTASFFLFQYYRMGQGQTPEFVKWRDKAAAQGFESAILDLRSSQLYREPEGVPVSGAALVILAVMVAAGFLLLWRRLRR